MDGTRFTALKRKNTPFGLTFETKIRNWSFFHSNIQKIELFININNFCNVYNFEKLLLLFYKAQEMLIDFII